MAEQQSEGAQGWSKRCLTELIKKQHVIHVATAVVEYRRGNIDWQFAQIRLRFIGVVELSKQVSQRHARDGGDVQLGLAKGEVEVVGVCLVMAAVVDAHSFCVN